MICIKSSPLEVFYYKGFLQICSKFIGEHPHENVTSEIHLNGQVLLLKGDFLFHSYITSSTKSMVAGECNRASRVEYQQASRVEYCKRKLRYRKDKLRRLQVCHKAKINK